MADSDQVISSKRKILEGEVSANKPNSEAVNQVIAGNINSFIDADYKVIEYVADGYFSTAAIFISSPIYIPVITDIVRYELSVVDSGSSGTCSVNFSVYDETYTYINELFSTVDVPRITAAGGLCLIGKDVLTNTDYKVESNAHSTDTGSLNITTIQGGYIIVGRVNGFSTSARSIRLKLYVREQ